MNRELADAVENLYRTFDRYNPGKDFESCSHCVSEAEEAELKRKALRELTCDDVSRYAFKAMSTWGTVDDFKHFLPRIFELIATREDFPIDIQVAIGKLSEGKWLGWSRNEVTSIEQFLFAWWRGALSQPFLEGTRVLANDVLSRLARVVEDLDPYLCYWDSRNDIEAGLHLASFVDWNFESLYKKGRINGAFWDKLITSCQVLEWLARSKRRSHLEQLFLDNSNHPHAYLLSESAQKLEWWAAKRNLLASQSSPTG
jgi:hypothetical protein